MNITSWIVVFAVILLGGWDIFAAYKWGYQGTISFDVLTASLKHPMIPFAVGVIAGHLFWPQ